MAVTIGKLRAALILASQNHLRTLWQHMGMPRMLLVLNTTSRLPAAAHTGTKETSTYADECRVTCLFC